MPLKPEFYQSRGKIARGVTDSVLAAKAQLQITFAAEMIGFVDVPEFDERHGVFDVCAWPSGF